MAVNLFDRRQMLGGAAMLLSSRLSAAAQERFPSRQITVIVPYPPGGSVDLVARALGDQMAQTLGQSIIVENRGGGGGAIGALAVAQADPDGYHIVLGTQQTHGTNDALIPNLAYKTIESFTPICGVCTVPHALVVKRDLKVSSAADLVAMLKSEPGKLNYGSTGNGSSSHLAAELFKIKTGVQAVHVPYRGGAPLVQDMVNGVVDFGFVAVANILGQIEGGLVRAIAIASDTRVPQLPGVPTLSEAGVADVNADAWFAYFAPARTPPERIAVIAESVEKALSADPVREAFRLNAVVSHWRPPADMPAFVAAEVKKWAEVVRLSGARADP